MKKHPFGTTRDGANVDIFTLENRLGVRVRVMTYGAIVVSLEVPDREGRRGDIVLGYDRLESYLERNPYFGAIIGRYANRIAKARFKLNGVEYRLAANNGENSLHGGLRGFDKRIWTVLQAQENLLQLQYLSANGEEGYPGNLTTGVTYSLTQRNGFRIDYSASTDQDTVVNLTHHSWFNLAGEGNGNIVEHRLQIRAERFTPIDSSLIPTGELRAVAGSPFDFRTMRSIQSGIDSTDEQIRRVNGYDHNFVLNNAGTLILAATLEEPWSGRRMDVFTTEPGIQLFSGNTLDGTIRGKAGKSYHRYAGLCLETQKFPDSPNRAEFPSAVLNRGKLFQSTTIYRFSLISD